MVASVIVVSCFPLLEPGLPFGVHGVEAVNAVALLDHLEDEGFFLLLLDAVVHQFFGDGRGDHQDAVGIGHDDVAGLDRGTAAGDGDVRVPGDVAAAQHGRVGIGEVGGHVQPRHGGVVADAAVGDDGRGAADLGTEGQDVAHGAGSLFTAGFHDQDFAFVHGVD